MQLPRFLRISAVLLLCSGLTAALSSAVPFPDDDDHPGGQVIPNTGQRITPLAARGTRFEPLNPGLKDFPNYVAGQAVTTAVSPDKKTLLILTSGYNRLNATSGPNLGKRIKADSNEYVFVYDITHKLPVKAQVLQIPNAYNGIAFDPSGKTFFVAGGVDDNVHVFDRGSSGWSERSGSPIPLGHSAGVGLSVKPAAAGLAVSADGNKLIVANYYNDSVSLLTRSSDVWSKTADFDLRPGKIDSKKSGTPGGEYPFWVAIKGATRAYVSSIRDREIDVLNIASATPTLLTRIKLKGQPNKMVLNASQSRLYVAQDESDSVAVIDTAKNRLLEDISVSAPAGLLPPSHAGFTGNNPDSVTLSPDEKTLYVTNGNTNNVAVVKLSSRSCHWPYSDRLVSQFGKLQRRRQLYVRSQRQIPHWPQSRRLPWRRVAGKK